MENKENLNPCDESEEIAKIRLSRKEEKEYYTSLRGQLIKLLYLIEEEKNTEGETNSLDLWFYGFVFDLASANTLCDGKLTKILVKIHGLYDGSHYKDMTHAQIKRQIMESRGILDHLISDLEKE